eukprot:Trichotokara_eunicae@DN2640_c0_g1_i1.p1
MIKRIKEENQLEPTFFEATTCMSFEHFRRKKVDWAIIETGLGGSQDSTNVVEEPKACVVTSIGWDHMHILGKSLEEIATEKAGILKAKAKVILGSTVTQKCTEK